MSLSRERPLAWVVFLGATGLYVALHASLLLQPLPDSFAFPSFPFVPPQHGLPLLLLVAAAAAGGIFFARPFAGVVPRAVGAGIGAYLCLAVSAQALGLAAWVLDRPLFTPSWWALATAVAAAAVRLLPRRGVPRGAPSPDAPADPLRPWLVATAILVAGLHLHAIARTIHRGARAWDGESYHLPVALQWLRLGSLTEALGKQVAVSSFQLDRFANPGNGELLMAVPLAAGWDRVACLVQLPFVLLAAWAVHDLARGVGASRGTAALSALAFASAPIVAEQAATPMLDLATGALSLCALAILVSVAGQAQAPRSALVLAALTLGLALGTKTTALLHMGLVAVVLALSRWPWKGRRRFLPIALLVLLPSAFWYARSAAFFGNAIHPVRIEVLGYSVLDGERTVDDMSGEWDIDRMGMKARWEWLAFPFRDPEYSDETGFGALLVPLGALGLAASLGRRRFDARSRLEVLVVVALALFWFAGARTPRFNLPLLGLGAALAAPVVDGLGLRAGRHAAGALGTLLSALTLAVSLHLHGWESGPPLPRAADLERDYPGIPAGIDALPPSVVFNDTARDWSSRPSNYKLFGADHRHLVYDHPGMVIDRPAEFVGSLRHLGVDAVFLRVRKDEPPLRRYATPDLEPVLRFEGNEFRSTVYRVR